MAINTFPGRIIHVFDTVMKELETNKGQTSPLYSSGLPALDEYIWGFHKGELTVIAGRPGEGKTSLMLYFGLQLAGGGNRVAFFTLEMTKEELMRRLISQVTHTNNQKIRRNALSDGELNSIKNQRQIFENMLFIIEETGYQIEQVEKKIVELQPDIVFLDYIQLANKGNHHSIFEGLSEYIRSLKEIAKKNKIIVIAGSQINRAPMNREEKRPLQSDMKGSGSIEETADLILANFWPWRYEEENRNLFEIGILKQRHGPLGSIKIKFLPEYYYFEGLTKEELDQLQKDKEKKNDRKPASSTNKKRYGLFAQE